VSVRVVIAVAGMLALGGPRSLLADEPPCIIADIRGIDSTMRSAVRDQLVSEIGVPIENVGNNDRCVPLRMLFEDRQVVIQLTGVPPLHTILRLDDVPSRHWPRAAALSAAGLLVRRRTLLDALAEAPSPPAGEGTAPKKKTDGSRKTASNSKTPSETDTGSENVGLELGLRLGGRLMPRFPAWVGETAAGVHITMGAVALGVSAVGVHGRRTVKLGQVFTSGGGLELSLRWHAVHVKRFHLHLGPAVEALAIYGYGRETASAEADNLLAPAVTVRLLAEMGFDLTTRLRLCLALSGGYNALGVTLQASHEDVSGLSGGYMTMAAGFDFLI
jgi:hypothetical protein